MKVHHYHLQLAVVFVLITTYNSFAQGVSINNDGAAANPYAILDINTTAHNKGVLFPRLTSAQLTTLQTTIAGLTVAKKLALKGLYLFNTDANSYYSYDGISSWGEVLTTANLNNNVWGLTGNAGTIVGTDFLGTTDARDVIFKSSNVELMRIAAAGNVGIRSAGGIPNASAMLDISATNKGLLIPRVALTGTTDAITIGSAATSLLVYNTATISDVTSGYYYWNGIKWERIATTSSTVGGSGVASNVAFWSTTSSLSSNASLYWDNTNLRLGIGTAVPSQKLHVFQASGGAPNLLIESNGISAANAPGITLDAGAANTGTSDIKFLENGVFKASTGWSTSSSQQYWFVYDGGSNQNMVYKAGNLGIGTTLPQHKLHINGLTGTPYVQVTDNITGSTATDGLIMGTNGAGSIYIVNQETAYNMSIGTASDNNLIKLNSSNNYVGIGTGNLAPAAKLDVDGGGSIQVDGDYTYEVAKTRYYTLSFSDFDIQDEINKDWLKTSGSYGTVVTKGTTTVSFGSVTAPLHLPSGAIIKEVRWYVATSSSTTSPNMRLKRTTLGSGIVGTISTAGVTTFSGTVVVSSVATLNHTTSNASYSYWLRSYLNTGQRLYGARVTYTVIKAE